jgi:hypothetical protein
MNKLRAKGIDVSTGGRRQSIPTWKVTTDGSITPSRGTGMEIVSPILKGQNGLDQLKIVCETLREWGGLINKTCGLHIHFDAENFSMPTWRNLYKNYIICEGTIDSMMPNSRRANNNYYCQSIIGNGSRTRAFRKLDNARTVLELSQTMTNRDRYRKVNAESFFRHKSIEFRQHSGTINYEKISNWILFLHGIVSYSEKGKIVTNGNFETMSAFMKNETHNFYHNRIQELAA